MFNKEDLIGTWKIDKNELTNSEDGKQEEMDKINSKYTITFNEDDTYQELNNGIMLLRVSNFHGSFRLEGNDIKLSMKVFKTERTYRVTSFDKRNGVMKLHPCDTLYCGIYTNIKSLTLKKI